MPEQKFLTNLDVAGTVDLSNLTIDSAQGTDGQVLTSTGTGIAWEDTQGGASETAERIEVTVKNISGGSLSKGTVVHTAPSANPPNGNVIEVIAADYDDITKMPAIGILNETIANEGEGSAVMMGAVSGIDTSSFSIGDELYVGNLGTLTNSKPTTAGQLIQKIAVVIKSHASNGLIKIFGAGRSNDVPLPLYIDNANQRVGIGDSTPSYTLDVNGTIYGSGVRSGRYYGTSGTSSYLDLDSGAPYSLLASSEVNVTNSIICNDLEATETGGIVASNGSVFANRFYGNGNTTYYVDPNNSTTAAVLAGGLEIGYGSAGEYRIEVGEGRTGNGYAYIDFVGDTTYSDYGLRLIRNNSGANTSSQLVHRGTGNLEFKTWDAGAMIFSTTNSERMRITSSGSVGIGTTSPVDKLQIDAANSQLRLRDTDDGSYTQFSSSGNTLAIRQGSTSASHIWLTSAGNVGIGIQTPGQKLDVSGNIKMTETAATTDTDKFVVLDSGVLKYRTGAQLRSDIGAGTSSFSGSYNDLSNKPTIPTNYLRNDAFDSGIGLYLQGGSFNAGTDTVTAPLVIDEEDFIYTKDGGYLRKLIGKTGDQIQIGQGGTSLINSINFLPGTAGNSAVKINSNTVWNAGNDGAGSGLDADLLDGQHGSYYYSSANLPTKIKAGGNGPSTENLNTVANSVSVGQLEYRGYNSSSSNKPPAVDNANGVITVGQHSGNYNAQLAFSSDGNIYWRDNPSSSFGSWRKMWDDGNLVTTSSGNRWDVVPTVSSSGVLEAGKYIDFHESDTTTSDYDYRITSTSGRLYFSGDIEIDGGDIYINDGNTRITEGVSNSLRAQTNSGYIDIGPQNTSHCHIRTDRSNFYFDKELQVNTGVVRSYDEDLNLNRAGSTTARLRITSGVTYSDQYLQASGSLRAPIFYDSNNTNYYTNPYGTSVLKNLTLRNDNAQGYYDGTIEFRNNSNSLSSHIEYTNAPGINAYRFWISASGASTSNVQYELEDKESTFQSGTMHLKNNIINAVNHSTTGVNLLNTPALKVYQRSSNISYTMYDLVTFHATSSASQVGSIRVNAYGTQYATSSDYRLKENEIPIADGIQRVKQLQPKRFNFIGYSEQSVDGFMAHEVMDIVPESVGGVKDEVDEESNPVYQSIDQSKLVPLLTAALQEAILKIEQLETRIQTLENQ